MCLLVHFCYIKIHFHQLGLFILIKNIVETFKCLYGLYPVWNRYPKGSQNTWTPRVQLSRMMN